MDRSSQKIIYGYLRQGLPDSTVKMIVWDGSESPPRRLAKPPRVPSFLHGWLGHGNRRVLTHLLHTDQPHTVIELGSWYGRSAQWMASHAHRPERLLCVDVWSETEIMDQQQVIRPHHPVRFQGECRSVADTLQDHPLWETFLVNLWPYRDRVEAVRLDTLTGLRRIYQQLLSQGKLDQVGLIYIDADHRYEAVCAEITLAHQLFPEARLVGDDYTAHRPVRRAVTEMADRLGFQVVTDHNCWYFLKK